MFILKSTELRLQFSLAWSVARHLAARGQNLTSYARSLPVGESVNEHRRGEAASELKRQHFHFFSSSPPAATHAQNRRPFQRQPPGRGRAPSSFRRPFCRRASQPVSCPPEPRSIIFRLLLPPLPASSPWRFVLFDSRRCAVFSRQEEL